VRKIGNLYPATLESIDAQGLSTTVTRAYNCGCSTSPDGYSIWLCQYHDGYDDGIERALRVAP
jgi:hypothetical protein